MVLQFRLVILKNNTYTFTLTFSMNRDLPSYIIVFNFVAMVLIYLVDMVNLTTGTIHVNYNC